MTTIGVQLSLFGGVDAAFLVYLYNKGVLINEGGDTLTEVSNGYFEAEVEETLSQSISYEAVITKDDVIIYNGWLLLSKSETIDDPGTGLVPESSLPEIDLTTFGTYGPKRVKTPNLEVEQFDPNVVANAERLARTPPSFCDSHVCIAKPKTPFVNPFEC